jgi:hypothetical protein
MADVKREYGRGDESAEAAPGFAAFRETLKNVDSRRCRKLPAQAGEPAAESGRDAEYARLRAAARGKKGGKQDIILWVADYLDFDPADIPAEGVPRLAAVSLLRNVQRSPARADQFFADNFRSAPIRTAEEPEPVQVEDEGTRNAKEILDQILADCARIEAPPERRGYTGGVTWPDDRR